MQDAPKWRSLDFVVALCVFAISAGLEVSPASAQNAGALAVVSAKPQGAKPQKLTQPANATQTQPAAGNKAAQKPRGQYYVSFRARTAASYGHAFVWYGRTDQQEVEVVGLHPASESIIPYVIGHVLAVPSETGASYGDLDEEYLTAEYRVFLTEPEAEKIFAYIKKLQATSPLWHAATFNCVWFIGKIAQYMGLRTPASNLLYPENWVNSLRDLNGALPTARLAVQHERQLNDRP